MTRFEVLFRDRWFLIVDKPRGVLSHPNPMPAGVRYKKGPPCAFEGPYDFEDRRFDAPGGPVWLVHRIDQDTSGVLLAALDKDSAALLRSLMDEGKVEKRYLALVAGRLSPKGILSDHLVKRKQGSKVRSVVMKKAHPNAKLQYSLKRFYRRMNLSLVDILLITGKTHQIRVQFAHRGCPIAGDDIYGHFPLNRGLRKQVGLRRAFLHAESLSFRHPKTNQFIKVESPLPSELTQCLSRLS